MPMTSEIYRWHELLYDKNGFAAAAVIPTTVRFFTIPSGAGTSPTAGTGTKGPADTNLDKSKELPSRYSKFIVKAIRLQMTGYALGPIVPIDAWGIMKNYVVQLYIDTTLYTNSTPETFPGGGGLHGFGIATTEALGITDATFGVGNGFPSSTAIFVLDEPIGIVQGSTFEVDMVGNATTLVGTGATSLGTGALLTMLLEGLADRAATS